jgi:hypothetical protein
MPLPNCTKSSTDIHDPNRPIPNTLMVDAQRANALKDKALPHST